MGSIFERVRILLLLGVVPACGISVGAWTNHSNLLLVTLDTVRADRLGAYGYETTRTPVLDALAARGVVFDQAYSPAPMTLPAHSTLMTGLLPPQHGARVNGVHRLEDDVTTLAERLSTNGYRTGAFVAAFVLDERFGLAQGFDHYDDDLTGAYDQEVANGLARYRPGNLVVDAALAWLEDTRAEGDDPFFAWVHLYDAHYPWFPHEDGLDEGTYDGEVAFVDGQVGRLASWLAENGLVDDTLVVAVADHGEGLGDHHEIEHAYVLNEEVLHVPWIVAGPGVQAGHRVRALVSLEDFQPTVLELFDLAGTSARGRSVSAALRGEPIESGASYAETDLPWTSFRWAPQRSLTTVEWKYVRTPQTELYDRATDRVELANMAVARKDVVREMEARLAALEAELGKRSSAAAALSADEIEQLAALGYVAGDSAEVPEDTAGLADVKERLPIKDLNATLRQRLARETIVPEEHLEIAQYLVRESPETPGFHSEVGTAWVALGNYAEALPAFERAVELAPEDSGLHYALGDALQQLGRHADARSHLEMALELEPRMAAAHVGMGNVLRDEGRPDLAAGSYTEALRLRPEYPEAHYNLALTFGDRGMPAKALEHYELALEQKPGWGVAHRALANLMLANGRFGEALAHLEATVEALGENAELRNDMGVCLQALGRPEEALAEYLAAMELAPAYFRPHLNRANMALEHGNDAIALAEYEAAVRLAPGLAEPTAQLARFLSTTRVAELRDAPRAVALAERAVDLTGGKSAHAFDTLAAAYAADGRFPEAVSFAHKAQMRARAAGDEGFAAEVETRIARYALGEPLAPAPASTAPAPPPTDEASPSVPDDETE